MKPRTGHSPGASSAILAACALAALGCGPDPEKRNRVAAPGAPLLHSSSIETVLELEMPPGNVTVSPEDRVFFTFHPAAKPDVHVAEVTAAGDFIPFPDLEWQEERENGPHFISPLAVRADDRGRLWILDHGDFGRQRPQLLAFEIASRELVHRFDFPAHLAGRGSMLNDFWVDTGTGFAYIADTSPLAFRPGLIVYDLESRDARRLLDDDVTVQAEDHHMIVQNRFLSLFGLPLRVAVDSIALSTDAKTLFYGPMTGSKLYAIATERLHDPDLAADELKSLVREQGAKPSTDGIAADSADRIYLTAVEHDAIWSMAADGTLSILARDEELLSWPDGVHLSADERYLYVTASELQHVIGSNLERLPLQRPFRILRILLPERGASPLPE